METRGLLKARERAAKGTRTAVRKRKDITVSSKPAARKYKTGDPVIWTDYHDGKQYPCEILRCIEPGDDDYHDYDPDLNGNGPLYAVHLKPGDTWDTQVAEVNLSPWPKPSLEAVDHQDET